MRFLMRVTPTIEKGNATIKDGSLAKKIAAFMTEHKPEAAYFVEDGGKRTFHIVINISDPSQIPAMAEPFFLGFDATVEFMPAMTAEDLMKAMPSIELAIKKYG